MTRKSTKANLGESMSRTFTARDRSALIRLASSLPKGSGERRAILAGLKKTSGDNPCVAEGGPMSDDLDAFQEKISDWIEGVEKARRAVEKMIAKHGPRGDNALSKYRRRDKTLADLQDIGDQSLHQYHKDGLLEFDFNSKYGLDYLFAATSGPVEQKLRRLHAAVLDLYC